MLAQEPCSSERDSKLNETIHSTKESERAKAGLIPTPSQLRFANEYKNDVFDCVKKIDYEERPVCSNEMER